MHPLQMKTDDRQGVRGGDGEGDSRGMCSSSRRGFLFHRRERVIPAKRRSQPTLMTSRREEEDEEEEPLLNLIFFPPSLSLEPSLSRLLLVMI